MNFSLRFNFLIIYSYIYIYPLNLHILTNFLVFVTLHYYSHDNLKQFEPLYIIAQSVTCRTVDMCLTADPGVASSIPARPHTFTEIYHEIISKVSLLTTADSRRFVVSHKRKFVHEVLVNCLVKLTQEKSVVR